MVETIFNLNLALSVVVATLGAAGCSTSLPKEIDTFFEHYDVNDETRVAKLDKILLKLKTANSNEDIAALESFMPRLAQLYIKTHDEAIIDTVDKSGGVNVFAMSKLLFYTPLLRDAEFVRLCRTSPEHRQALHEALIDADDEVKRERDRVLMGVLPEDN